MLPLGSNGLILAIATDNDFQLSFHFAETSQLDN